MIRMNQFGILTFQSTHHAMRAEKVLLQEGIGTKTIPTPRDISLSCGLAIRIDAKDVEAVRELKKVGTLDYKEVYSLRTEGKERTLIKLD